MLKLKPDSSSGKTVFTTSDSQNIFREISEETTKKTEGIKVAKSIQCNDQGKENASATNFNRKSSALPSPSWPKGNLFFLEIFSKLLICYFHRRRCKNSNSE